MNRFSGLRVMAAAVLGAALAMSAYAGEMSKKGDPASVDESKTGQGSQAPKGKSGVATPPSKGPASVDESKTGQGSKGAAVKGASKDDSKMANPKTPASVDESKTGQTMDDGAKKYGKKKGDKDKEGMAK